MSLLNGDDDRLKRLTLEREEKWNEHSFDMPFFKVPTGFEMKVVAPTGGALTRFKLRKGSIHFSIYYDINDSLGEVNQPYYELYPLIKYEILCDAETLVETLVDNGDTKRYYTTEFNEMIQDIIDNTTKQEEFMEKYPEYFI